MSNEAVLIKSRFDEVFQGDDVILSGFSVQDSAGAVVDLSSRLTFIRWGMQSNALSGTTDVTKSYPASGINIHAVKGYVEVALSGMDTSGLTQGRYAQQLSVQIDNQWRTVSEGVVWLRPEIV